MRPSLSSRNGATRLRRLTRSRPELKFRRPRSSGIFRPRPMSCWEITACSSRQFVEAIVDRPAAESDLVAIWQAIQAEWVVEVNSERTARKARIVATSGLLTGLSYHSGQRWLAALSEALAQRNDLEPGDERCSLAARVGLGALASAVESWIAEGCDGDLGERVDISFGRMRETCRELSGPESADERFSR